MKVKDIVQIALFSATLTVGKTALAIIPNVEIVTFMLIIITLLFNMKKSLIAVFIFVTTDMMIYGFGTWVLVYYVVWSILVLGVGFLRKFVKGSVGWAAVSGIFGLLFGFFFAVGESFFYGLAYGVQYWIRGIPFDAIHMVSNYTVMIILYDPIVKLLTSMESIDAMPPN